MKRLWRLAQALTPEARTHLRPLPGKPLQAVAREPQQAAGLGRSDAEAGWAVHEEVGRAQHCARAILEYPVATKQDIPVNWLDHETGRDP